MNDLSNLPKDVAENVEKWLNGPYDEKTKGEINVLIKSNREELLHAFSGNLKFGTGGMRGVMGPGTNRLNIYTIRFATQGLANYINKNKQENEQPSVVICYDCRHHSKEFAHEAAKVLSGNNIKAYVSKDLRPTPFTSFICRLKRSNAAIMITASHNSSEYNGYKVYGKDGAQVAPPIDQDIVEQVKEIENMEQISLSEDLIEHLNERDDSAYLEAIKKLQIHPHENANYGHELKVVYSSLHGAGITLVPTALNQWGFTDVAFVEKQVIPDGDFPTCPKPNPENPKALELGMELLKEQKRDIFIATDPDSDRMGVVAFHKSKPVILTGNELACIFLYHIFHSFEDLGIMPANGAVVTTIVTTRLFKAIADRFSIPCIQVLTGFKYIGQKIHQWEQEENGYSFLFGAEESYGYLFGTHARDKDATIAACLMSEIALQLKRESKTLVDRLYEIYKEYGIYREGQLSIEFDEEHKDQMINMMKALRTHPPKQLEGVAISDVIDLLQETEKFQVPKADVLIFEFEDQSTLIVRPSGTEPKVKIYGMIQSSYDTNIEDKIKSAEQQLTKKLEAFRELCLNF